MESHEKLETLGTQETGRRLTNTKNPTKHNTNKTQKQSVMDERTQYP